VTLIFEIATSWRKEPATTLWEEETRGEEETSKRLWTPEKYKLLQYVETLSGKHEKRNPFFKSNTYGVPITVLDRPSPSPALVRYQQTPQKTTNSDMVNIQPKGNGQLP